MMVIKVDYELGPRGMPGKRKPRFDGSAALKDNRLSAPTGAIRFLLTRSQAGNSLRALIAKSWYLNFQL